MLYVMGMPKRGVLKWRTIVIDRKRGLYAHVAIMNRKGKRGGRTVIEHIRQKGKRGYYKKLK